MQIEYKLIDPQKKGYITTREAGVADGDLVVTFIGAPAGATAIFENARASLYRPLSDDSCVIPIDFMQGEIRVCVTVLNGSESAPKYYCESIFAKKTSDGIVIVPNGLDIPSEIIGICSMLESLNDKITQLEQKENDLAQDLKRLLNGYDFI